MHFRVYNIINALSLDVALGAGVLSLVFGRYLGFRVPVFILLILVLTVWVIYTADHLLDAKTIKGQASSFRHHFHQHFYKPILVALAVSLALILFLMTQIPLITVFYGVPVLLVVIGYFVLNLFFQLGFQKELLVSILYVAGIFVGPLSLNEGNIPREVFYLLVQLGLMAWVNLLIFSLFEVEEDKQDKLKSTAIIWGVDKTGMAIKLLLVGCFSVGLIGLATFYNSTQYVKLQIVFLLMAGILGTLFFRKESIAQNGLQYRYFGDGIFFMPVAYFWF